MPLNVTTIGESVAAIRTTVWLHGFLGRGADWREIVTPLAPDVLHLLPDLPGHGESAAVPDGEDALEAVLRDLIAPRTWPSRTTATPAPCSPWATGTSGGATGTSPRRCSRGSSRSARTRRPSTTRS